MVVWPPKPGELWVADEEWPDHGISKSVSIMPGDVVLVLEAGAVEITTSKQVREWQGRPDCEEFRCVNLQVLVHGIRRPMTTEWQDGKIDIHPLGAS